MKFSIDELSNDIPNVRQPESKMGMALARRTIFRAIDKEDWGRVATRVALGNTLLMNNIGAEDFKPFRNKLANGEILMSGRHLQHGDEDQPNKRIELLTNCSTASSSFIKFYLLLNGSGVGRSYDDQMMLIDWSKAPKLINACNIEHPDFNLVTFDSPESAAILYPDAITFKVPDSREGWASAFEIFEVLTFEGTNEDKVLVIDWSDVRAKGSPIAGMQDRPASGPTPTADAFKQCSLIKHTDFPRWKQTMFIDHYLAECVVVGGARRSARLACKNWKDSGALEFATLKRDNPELWSSNNSLVVDEEFWKQEDPWAVEVLNTCAYASYHDGTGEPGFINVDKFAPDTIDASIYLDGFLRTDKLPVSDNTLVYISAQAEAFAGLKYKHIVNPCGEIALIALSGYCLIGDVVPYNSNTLDEAEDSFRIATRALIRTNTMPALYQKEVDRTNRIGVSFTGIHEFAWKFFGLGFRDMLDENGRGKYFWQTINRFSCAVKDEAKSYAAKLGMATPITDCTVKPSGSVSKLYGVTEGAHLPAMREYIRWMQFRSDDPLVERYKALGYPHKDLVSYSGTTVIGFPTRPEICKIGMPYEQIVTAAEATPEEQYLWLQLIEKYWLRSTTATVDTGNQVSFTLKYDPEAVTYGEFLEMMKRYQPTIKCCSVMPQTNTTAYEYQPEQPVTSEEFNAVVAGINDPSAIEEFDLEALKCASGSCPI